MCPSNRTDNVACSHVRIFEQENMTLIWLLFLANKVEKSTMIQTGTQTNGNAVSLVLQEFDNKQHLVLNIIVYQRCSPAWCWWRRKLWPRKAPYALNLTISFAWVQHAKTACTEHTVPLPKILPTMCDVRPCWTYLSKNLRPLNLAVLGVGRTVLW